MFVNFSNHPSALWSAEQLAAAARYGDVLDVPFPVVPAMADETDLIQLAEKYTEKILRFHPDAVLCQGEMTMTFLVVTMLQQQNIPVLAACSDRVAVEKQMPDGSTEKSSRFVFRRFRNYGGKHSDPVRF